MYYMLIAVACIQIIISKGQPVQNVTSKIDEVEEQKHTVSNNQTIGELITQSTENVKKIVANQYQQASTIDYPVVTKLEPDYSAEAKKQIEKLSLEELKIKCQQLSKLIQINKTNQNSLIRPSNHKPYDYTRRPIYIQPKTTLRPKYSTTSKPNGFYITQSTATQKPTANAQSTPIKYIRLEPVILQKTILGDGRTVYYWHRSLPTAVEIASDSTQNNQVSSSPPNQEYPYNYDQSQVYTTYNNIPYAYGSVPYRYAPLSQNSYINAYQNGYTSTEDKLGEDQKSAEVTTESSTTSTTEQASYGYGFGSFLPFYSYRQETSTTTTEPTTTTTTLAPVTEKLKTDDLLYAHQLKFIIPVPYEDLNGGTRLTARNPWEFDQYAYYPKDLQPNTMNVQLPYNPTFHMIRAIEVPSSVSKMSEEINS